MAGQDDEILDLRARVDCQTVLEQAGWMLDAAESSRAARKYRLGSGRIVIVTHEGRGWFDPVGKGRGDVLALAQHVWGGTLGSARKRLRPLAGIAPRLPTTGPKPVRASFDVRAWWSAAIPTPGSPGWRYVTGERALPSAAVERVVVGNGLREGVNGTCWGAHVDAKGALTGWEMRGPHFKGLSAGGGKALFACGSDQAARIAVCEGMIDAMSLACLEEWRADTRYASTGGGWRDGALAGLRAQFPRGGVLVAATDRGLGGERLAERLRKFADEADVGFERMLPASKDWNDDLRALFG